MQTTTEEHLQDGVNSAQAALNRWREGGLNASQVLIDVKNALFALEQAQERLRVHMGD